jgi:hypothetical protein
VPCAATVLARQRNWHGTRFLFTCAPNNSGRMVVVCCTQLCNLEELLRTLQKVLGGDVPFQRLRANERLAVDKSLRAGAIVQRVLNHRCCCDGRESDERKQMAHDNDVALDLKSEGERRLMVTACP